MAVTVEMKTETEDWLDKARSDLDDARFNAEGGASSPLLCCNRAPKRH